ncbi:MAG: NFACT RNA binding domain-containing protein [Cyanobacteriota bacterium]|nr:NFACT RNA binding domain-containing protein [Cyanobacteriota bacterium]
MSAPRLQAIDATTLKALLAELRRVVLPSRFEKAQQADGQTLQLALRHLGGVQWLEISWLAEAPRILAIPPPPRTGEGSTLAQQLQHGLRGLALVAIRQEGWERVVSLDFAVRPGEPIQRQLVVELMGRHSNLFLLGPQGQVIALARQVRPQQSQWRPIGTGDPYSPPPALQGEPPRSSESFDTWRRRLLTLPLPLGQALMEAYQGVSPALVGQLLEPREPESSLGAELPVQSLTAEQWNQLWRSWRDWLTAVEEERFGLHWQVPGAYRCWPGPEEVEEPSLSLPIHAGLAQASQAWLANRGLERRRHALRHRLEALKQREHRQEREQQALLEAAAGSEELQRQADDLLCAPAPSKERIQQAQALYKRARKLRRSVAAIRPRLEAHRQRQAWLEDALLYVDQADHPEPLAALEEDLRALEPKAKAQAQSKAQAKTMERASAPQRRRGESQGQTPQPLELPSPSGLRLQVGRNHRQNEWISLRQARRGDLWFHAQEVPGSHVVLKASEGPAEDADLEAAADLAAHFSRGRGNARVPVVMVPTEALQRLAGEAAGTVRHRGGQIVWGQPERALRLLHAS